MWIKSPLRKYYNLVHIQKIDWYFDSGTETVEFGDELSSRGRTTFSISLDSEMIVFMPLSETTAQTAPAYIDKLDQLLRHDIDLWDLSDDEFAVRIE